MTPAIPNSFRLQLPKSVLALIQRCEVICVAGCCGVDAFDRTSVHMLSWFRENAAHFPIVLDQLSDVLRLVAEQPGQIVSYESEFNHIWPTADECVDYLREWRLQILQAAETARGRPLPSVDPAWLTSTVVALARGIYDDRAFDRLPILADAFQDAGCDNDDILNHCRDTGTLARGCWVVDLVLTK